jgi:putative intracellular protease/amidase
MPKQAFGLKPVLFVVTSTNVKGDTGIPTGFNVAEVTHSLEKLQAAGIQVEFASPKGGAAPSDGMVEWAHAVKEGKQDAVGAAFCGKAVNESSSEAPCKSRSV